MTLKSTILFPPPSGNRRLNLAYSDRNHPLAFGEPQCEAVARIQSALRDLGFKLPNSASSKSALGFDGIFGAETLDRITAFQRTHPPLRVDGMVGEHTLNEMDAQLMRPKPPPIPSLQIIPFHEATPMLIAQQPHDLAKSDLNNTPSTPALPISAAGLAARSLLSQKRNAPTPELENDMRIELLLGGGVAGVEALDDFIKNPLAKVTITKGIGSRLAELVHAATQFKDANEKVKAFVTDALRESAATGILDYQVLRESGGKVPPPLFGFTGSDPLHFVIGSFQGSNVFLEDFSADATTRAYRAVLIYEFFDHFGADDDDLVNKSGLRHLDAHGSPGQVALWVLQRERHPNHQPFVLKVVIEETIADTL